MPLCIASAARRAALTARKPGSRGSLVYTGVLCRLHSSYALACRPSNIRGRSLLPNNPLTPHQDIQHRYSDPPRLSRAFKCTTGLRQTPGEKEMDHAANSRSAPYVEVVADHMERPDLDNRTYRVIKLPNQLEALLIHDAETDKASASLDVNVGSFSDMDDMPGIAHAVEHLLFMGTEKYPVENAYNQYLTAHSGSSNAFTASTSTNYYFEVAASNTPSNSGTTSAGSTQLSLPIVKTESPLYGALDRFAQFFVKPLFLADTLDRELRAVDSENKKNLQNDTWRLHQLNKTLSNPKHPYHHFSTGSYKTLHDDPLKRGVQIRDEFIKFYETHYSANRMKLVVLGRETLDELQEWVEELFANVPNKDLQRNRWDEFSPYTEKELGSVIFARPVYEMRLLDLYFPFPDEELLYEQQPSRYIGHLLGHEGPGSILAYTKAKGWANGLGAGPVNLCPGSSFFSVSIRLTEDGLKHYQEILQVLFQYIAMLGDQPPQEWVYEEMKKMSEVNFKYKQKSPASKTTSSLSQIMQKPYPRDWLLSGPSLLRKFDPQAITDAMSYLRPDNFRMTIVDQKYPGDWDQKEKWYGTEYKTERMSSELKTALQDAFTSSASQRPAELYMPEHNDFIPTRLEVDQKKVDKPLSHPKLLRNDDSVRTWWKKDDQFWVPKGYIHVTLRTPLPYITARCAVIAQMYRELVQDELNEYAYAAEIAGLEYSVSCHSVGIDIAIAGYNDKMAVLLEKVLLCMRDIVVREDRFQINKERLLRSYRNWEYQQPFHQVGTFFRWLSMENGWINEQYLQELPSITADDVRNFYQQILQQAHIEILAHGNLYKEDALTFTKLVESTLRPKTLPPSQWPVRRNLVLPAGCNYVYERTLKDPQNVNHCIEYALYIGQNTDRALRAKLLLFAQCTDEPAFNTLRTNEQLGYVVFSGAAFPNTSMGYRVLVQSEKRPEYLEQRIDSFLTGFGKTLAEMEPSKFEKLKGSLINKRLERLKNLGQETNRFVSHILSEAYDFEQVYRDVEHLQPLTLADLQEFYDYYIAPKSPDRAKLSVHLLAQATPASIAEALTRDEQRSKLLDGITEFLASFGITAEQSKIKKRFAGVDIQSGNKTAMVEAMSAYLSLDEAVPEQKVQTIIAQGEALLTTVLPGLGIEPEPTSGEKAAVEEAKEAVANGEVAPPQDNGTQVVRIEDVHSWKMGMTVAAGARPVTDLSAFEETGAKL